jgi:hypothetical protein
MAYFVTWRAGQAALHREEGRLLMRGSLFKGVVLGSVCSALVFIASSALAGSGIGGVFNLGVSNSVNAKTTLTGSTAAAQLQVTNTNAAAGASGLGVSSASTSATGSFVNSSTGVGVYGQSSGYGVSGKGKFGLVGNGTDSGVWATSANAAGSGVYGQNTTSGRGVYGKSSSGRGVWGQSTSGIGVYGESTSAFGIYGFSQGWDGIYGASTGVGRAGVRGSGDRFGVAGQGKTGVFGATTDGSFAYEAIGNAKQNRAGGGWVKPMAEIDPFMPAGQQVRQCFNSQVALGTPSCGITPVGAALGRGISISASTSAIVS